MVRKQTNGKGVGTGNTVFPIYNGNAGRLFFIQWLIMGIICLATFGFIEQLHAECIMQADPISGDAPLTVRFKIDGLPSGVPYESLALDPGDGGGILPLFFLIGEYTYEAPGTYLATFTATETAGAYFECSQEITVGGVPGELNVVLNPDKDMGPAPLDVAFNAFTTGGAAPYSYHFEFGDGTEPIMQDTPDITHTYASEGYYTASVSVTDSQGVERTAAVDIYVEPGVPPTELTISLEADSVQGDSPLTTTFFATAEGGRKPYQFLWEFGDETPPIKTREKFSHDHTYLKAGTFEARVTVTDSLGTQVVSNRIQITVEQYFNFEIDVYPNAGFAPFSAEFYVLLDTRIPIASFTYDFGDGSSPLTQRTDKPWKTTHVYSKKGEYTAKVTLTSENGRTISRLAKIWVKGTEDLIVISQNLDEMDNYLTAANDFEALVTSMNSITELMEQSLGSLSNLSDEYSAGAATIEQTAEAESSDILDKVDEKLDTLVKASTSVASKDVVPVLDETGGMLEEMARNNVPMKSDFLPKLKSISSKALKVGAKEKLGDLLTDEQLQSFLDDPQQAKTVLSKNTHKIADVVSISEVPVGVKKKIENQKLETEAEGYGLTDDQSTILKSAIPETVDSEQKVVKEDGGQTKSLLDMLVDALGGRVDKSTRRFNRAVVSEGALSDNLGGVTSTTVDEFSGAVDFAFANATRRSVAIKELSVVPDYLPEGFHTMNDGTQMIIKNDFAISVAPAPLDLVSIAAIVTSWGFVPEFDENGRFLVDTQDGKTQFMLAMGWEIISGLPSRSGTVSFGTQGSNPSSEAYSLLATYGDGSSQMMAPSIRAEETFLALLDKYFPGLYSLDRETGVLDFYGIGMRFKPDYIFEQLSDIDYETIRNSGGFDLDGSAFEISDFSADGILDLKYYSPSPKGAQILYTIP